MKRTLFVAVVVAGIVDAVPAATSAAPPILQSVTFENSSHVLSVT